MKSANKPDKVCQVATTLEEWQLLKRLRQLRNQGRDNVLLVDVDDCREVGTLKRKMTRNP